MKITISGTVQIHRAEDYEVVTDLSVIRQFDGCKYSDERMADYIADGSGKEEYAKIGLKGGFIELRFDESEDRLWVDTCFGCPRKLSSGELDFLVDYTRGQWSDGMGENMEIELADEMDLLVELYNRNQEIRTREEK